MKYILTVSLLLIFAMEAVAQNSGRYRDRNSFEREGADQVVIKELQREVLEGIQLGRQNRQLSAKEARGVLKQYSRISSREIKLYKKRKLNERRLAEVRADLESLVQELYNTVRFDKNPRGGLVRTRR